MNAYRLFFSIAIRAFGAGALLLGLAFWLGFARSLTQLHIGLGIGLVVSLWVVSWFAWTRTKRIGPAALAATWGLVTWVFGVLQTQILPGSLHWVVQLVHLAIGGIAVVLGVQLAMTIGEARSAPSRS